MALIGRPAESATPRLRAGLDGSLVVRVVVACAVLGVSLARAIHDYAIVVATANGPHQTGDWLISYADGFVRRGLFGELFLAIAPQGKAAVWVLFALQVGLWLAIVAFGVRFMQRSNVSWTSLALTLGPAALTFPGWDTLGGFRKEMLGFAVLLLLALARTPAADAAGPAFAARKRVALQGAALLLFVLAVFSWEANALLLPAVAYLLLTTLDGRLARDSDWAFAGLFTIVAGAGVWLSMRYPGDEQTAFEVCARVVRQDIPIGDWLCGGSMAWLGSTANDTLLLTKSMFPQSLYIVLLGGLGLAPLLATAWFRKNWRWGLAIIVGVVPLFFIASDYGRWVHMIAMALLICVAASPVATATTRAWETPVVIVFLLAFGIPHSLMAGTIPWLGFGESLLEVLFGSSVLLPHP